ncbi:MAG: DUF5791 family protein [Halapricum sp.]
MLTGRFPDAGERDPPGLLAAYQDVLATVIDDQGTEAVVTETGVDRDTVTALAEGDAGEVTLEDAAAALSVAEDYPDADAIAAEARDILLMGMTTAVMDVDSVAAELGGDLDPKEVQQKVEGRHPITLGEYARIHHLLERKP